MTIALVLIWKKCDGIMTANIDNYLGLHATALKLRSQRAKLLANNLANADTPNYKARDIDFRSTLQQASQNKTIHHGKTHAAHIPLAGNPDAQALQYRVPTQPSLDGNTVDTQVEQAKFTDNAIRYQTSLQFLNKRITGLIRTLRSE